MHPPSESVALFAVFLLSYFSKEIPDWCVRKQTAHAFYSIAPYYWKDRDFKQFNQMFRQMKHLQRITFRIV